MHPNKQMLFDQVSTFKGYINHLAHTNNSNLFVSDVHNVRAGKGYSQSKVYIDVCKKGEWTVTFTIDMSNYYMTGSKTLGTYPKKQSEAMIDEATSFYYDYVSKGYDEINGVNAAKQQKVEADKQRIEYIDNLKSDIHFDFLYNESLMDQYTNVEYYNNFIASHNVTDKDVKEILFNNIKRKYRRAGKEYTESLEVVSNEINECNNKTTNNDTISYEAYNRSFPSYEEAEAYCISNDFDTGYIKEVATQQPSNNSYNSNAITDQPEVFHLYKNTFTSYNEAYNYALSHHIPVTMIISSLHPYMTNERLQELEKEYTFSKGSMSYNDMKEYFSYISSLNESLDQQERYYKLKSYIKRYEYKQQQKKDREEHLRDLMREACTLLHFMKKKGLQLINKSDCGISSTKYIYNNNVLHFDVHSNGMPIEEYHTMIYNIFNNHFSDYINEYNQYTLYWYYMPDGNTETLTQIDSYVFIDSTIGEHGIIAYDRRLTDSEINKYKLVTCNYYSDQSII